MTGLTEKITELVDSLSIDEVLRCLIIDSDLEEVVCCLDMIAKEHGQRVKLYDKEEK